MTSGLDYPRADVLFEMDYVLDLGGVRVQLSWLGPTHTSGDTAIFVEGDNVLFAGDLAMKQLLPAFASPYGDGTVWLASLDKLEAMRPKVVLGSHGGMSDAAMIVAYREVLKAIGVRIAELKAQGKSETETGKQLTSEFATKYPDWAVPVSIPAAVAVYYKMH